jgi:hypothetical protein
MMLIKGSDGLFVPVFEEMKAVAIQRVHGFVVVSDYDIDKDEIRVGVENGCGLSWRCGGRGLSLCADCCNGRDRQGCKNRCGEDSERMHRVSLFLTAIEKQTSTFPLASILHPGEGPTLKEAF